MHCACQLEKARPGERLFKQVGPNRMFFFKKRVDTVGGYTFKKY